MKVTYDATIAVDIYFEGDEMRHSMRFNSLAECAVWLSTLECNKHIDVVDSTTGEVLLTAVPEDEVDWKDEEDEIDEEYSELGFNPYMGYYDFDF